MFGSKETDDSSKSSDASSSQPKPQKKPSRLDFEGKKYDLDALPDDLKEALKGLQVAESQMRMYQGTIKLLDLSRKSLIVQLKQGLEKVPSLDD